MNWVKGIAVGGMMLVSAVVAFGDPFLGCMTAIVSGMVSLVITGVF